MIGWLTARRHGRGFGVHSPLAYELITGVLRDRPAYYGDAEIARQGVSRRQQRLARIVLRLTARFCPSTAFADPESTLYLSAAKIARKSLKTTSTASEADIAFTREGRLLKIRVGHPESPTPGPLVLTNRRDIEITIYRRGLSPVTILTHL